MFSINMQYATQTIAGKIFSQISKSPKLPSRAVNVYIMIRVSFDTFAWHIHDKKDRMLVVKP